MKVLVTGAGGQLGSELKRQIKEHSSPHDFTFVDVGEIDLSKPEAIASYLSRHSFDVVINCAAYTAVDKAEEDEALAYAINATAVQVLSDIAAAREMRLIHISTDYVFDGSGNQPLTEESVTNPLGVYGKSKLVGETEILQRLSNAYIVRTSWLYSVFGKNFVKTISTLARERESLNVVYDQVGTPTNARDLAKLLLTIVGNIHSGINDKPGLYHFSNEGVTSWYDFAKFIVDYYGLPCKIHPVRSEEYKTLAARPKFSVLDKLKVKKHLNAEVPYWRDSLRSCLDELRVNS